MYKNETEGAIDAGDDQTSFIVQSVEETCNFEGYAIESDLDRLKTVRDNMSSPFMLASEGYILILMTVLLLLVAIIIPQKMKEHHVPMLMRQADENMFHVMMRIRCYFFLAFIALSGCLCQLTNYFLDTCLHTKIDTMLFHDFDLNMTDYYQFSLCCLIWFITVPIIIFNIG